MYKMIILNKEYDDCNLFLRFMHNQAQEGNPGLARPNKSLKSLKILYTVFNSPLLEKENLET